MASAPCKSDLLAAVPAFADLLTADPEVSRDASTLLGYLEECDQRELTEEEEALCEELLMRVYRRYKARLNVNRLHAGMTSVGLCGRGASRAQAVCS